MVLWHGSEIILPDPSFGKGKPYNDYGIGFYCTESRKMAMEWAARRDHDGYANRYDLDEKELSVLYLNREPWCILHWLAVLLENRTFEIRAPLAAEAREYLLTHFVPPYKNYDLIIGYRADDSYFSFAQDFLNGTISVRQLRNAMHLGYFGEQIVLKSERAFEQLRFMDYEIAGSKEWYLKRQQCDQSARKNYFDLERNKRQKGDLFVLQIIDEEVKADDPRLRSNLS